MDPASTIPTPSPEKVKEDVRHLKEWLSKESHLPKIEDEAWLEIFLFKNKYSLEKTKRKLENYYTFRTKFPKYLKNRDPTSPELLLAKEAVTQAVSNKLTKTGEIVFFYKHKDESILNTIGVVKRSIMIYDMLLLEHPKITGWLSVTDCDTISYQYILKSAIDSDAQAEITKNSYTERLKAIHLINAPRFINIALDIVKKSVSRKAGDRIYTHTSPNSTLLTMVDEDVLCSDFGGKGPSLAELDEYTQKLLEKHKKWFLEQDSICSNESLRIKNDDQVDELKGSFRKLEVD